MMKRLLSLALVLCMVLSFSVCAFADDTEPDETPKNQTSVNATFTKTYKLENDGSTSPAETFTFEFTAWKVEENDALSVDDMPDIDDATVDFGESEATKAGTEKEVTVDLSNVKFPGVGVYYYKVTEKEGSTGGVVYDNSTQYLKITVANNTVSGTYYVAFVTLSLADEDDNDITDDKSNGFENTYQAASDEDHDGGIQISKNVTGNAGDKDREYEFTLTITGEEGKTYLDEYNIVSTRTTFDDADTENVVEELTSIKIEAGVTHTYTFTLKHGETVYIENVPYGVTYTVTEEDLKEEGYTTTIKYDGKVATSGEVDAAKETVAVENNKGVTVDTGVMLDTIPYIALMLIATAGLAVVITKKRHSED